MKTEDLTVEAIGEKVVLRVPIVEGSDTHTTITFDAWQAADFARNYRLVAKEAGAAYEPLEEEWFEPAPQETD